MTMVVVDDFFVLVVVGTDVDVGIFVNLLALDVVHVVAVDYFVNHFDDIFLPIVVF
jgi:hypothetical protein